MYKSPIEIITKDIELQMEDSIMRAVQKYDINIDKIELKRALNFDRQQYSHGYMDAMNTIIRCKFCCFTCQGEKHIICTNWGRAVDPDGYCYLGERG